MRLMLLAGAVVAGAAFAQTMTESAAVAGGVTAGSAGGKKVSEGINAVFRKVEGTAKQAAQKQAVQQKPGTVGTIQVGPGTLRPDSVPPPPEPSVRARRPAAIPKPELPQAAAYVPPPVVTPAPPPPPLRQASAEDLRTVRQGMSRDEVLKLGAPASRITMFDDGHLVEVYRYMARDVSLGAVRFSDGAVSGVILPR